MKIPVKSRSEADHSLTEGGVYVVHSGDETLNFAFVKLVRRDGDRIGIRAHPTKFEHWPDVFDPRGFGEPVYLTVHLKVFLAWGPPELPARVGFEAVTQDDIEQLDDPDSPGTTSR